MICQYSLPVLTILRGVTEDEIEPIANLIQHVGMGCVEVTMNTPNAPKLIDKLVNYSGAKLAVGAGTVLTTDDLDKALNAGAGYIVTPGINEEVIKFCTNNRIPIIPGALTPTEVMHAWNLGADMVKIFPASAFGPKYLKDLKGPLDKIRLMAVGGVNEDTIVDYFQAGASAVAIGGGIFKRSLLDEKNYDQIEQQLKKLVDRYFTYKKTLS